MKRLTPFLLLVTCVHGAPTAAPPATLSKEADLTTITLTPEAEQRLRLQTVAVERRAVPTTRLFAGEIVLALGNAEASPTPVLGGTLDERLHLADQQAQADGRIAAAKIQVEAATLAVERAQKVFQAEAGSARNLDEARSALGLAQAALATAQQQRALLGAPVGTASARSPAWVRVAIFSGEAALLDGGASAVVRPLTSPTAGHRAAPVRGPLTANAAAATVDWYYELPADLALRPGERVAVEVATLAGREEALVVPFAAVLHDIHGGQWVYEAYAPHKYTRRRVQVARLVETVAVLASGPAVGARIVTAGAAELFGTEFMTGK